MFRRQHWIPPGALIFAQLSHGASWLILLWAGVSGSIQSLDFRAIAWIHTVALGWATLAALAVLLHVVPRFADVTWKMESVARGSLGAFAVGVLLFVAALLIYPRATVFAAGLLVISLLTYVAAALATLGQAQQGERTERAIARALATTFGFLAVTALFGFALSFLISGYRVPSWVADLPAAHANLGMLGWLTLLIFGVSTRTVRPITGNRSRFVAAHIATGSFAVTGAVLLALGLGSWHALLVPGAALFGLAILIYVLDMVDILRRTTVPRSAAQGFLAAAIIWLACGSAIGAATLSGKPWQLAYGFLILAGWVGQMLNAHVYHIGVRLLLTIYRGEEDETRPHEVLDSRLSWGSFAAFQFAVLSGGYGLLLNSPGGIAIAGFSGLAGWVLMIFNLVLVRTRVKGLAT